MGVAEFRHRNRLCSRAKGANHTLSALQVQVQV